MATLTLPNRVESVRPATAFVVRTARAMHVPAATEPVFEVAVSEAIANAVTHGRGRRKDSTIRCDIEIEGPRLMLRILDGGPGFQIPSGAIPELSRQTLETLPEAGYGLPIIRSVFPIVRVIEVNGRFGVELGMPVSR
jgi:anti-sigma regulatory factor (Ser/Thr protein kinase)